MFKATCVLLLYLTALSYTPCTCMLSQHLAVVRLMAPMNVSVHSQMPVTNESVIRVCRLDQQAFP